MSEPGEISASELHDATNVTIVDIRKNPDDRQIPNSIRLNGEELEAAEHPPFAPGERVVLYCGSGNSCKRVATALRSRGINAQALTGGYTAWPYQTEPRK